MQRHPVAGAALLAALIGLAGCTRRVQTWPDEPPDIVGYVQDVRVLGRPAAMAPSVAGLGDAGGVRRLNIRVVAGPGAAAGSQAYVGVDGLTQVGRNGAARGDDVPELQGAYVRVWLRSPPRWWSPIKTEGMARMIAIDSVATTGPSASDVDSALVGRILVAEDRRDSTDLALAQGARHSDGRIRSLAQRARVRIRDPLAAARDSMGTLPAPHVWAEPAWKGAYRALAAPTAGCTPLRGAVSSGAWQVRLRAADLVTVECAADDSLAATLRGWIDALPADASRRARDGVSWHAGAHGLVALARMRPAEARARAAALARHGQWQVRAYAARAAGVLSDTATLRALVGDANANVREAAIVSLSKLTGHADDSLFLTALAGSDAPAVRAAAVALEGSPRADVATAANASFNQWIGRANASERDVRVALLKAAGRPASDDRAPPSQHDLPPGAVALALGQDVRLRVRLAPSAGGGSFVVRLRGDAAPMMAARIVALARAHYYDGTDWHRVEPDFVIQGGSAGSNEYVGAPRFLRDELGPVPHLRGTVGMSTRGHDTGDAQWFVNLKDNRRLDRDYTVFAEVVEGMDVVDGILEGDAIATIEEVAPSPAPPRAAPASPR
jgi:cyclophilin family peptidyl-prolyl cis-trans isomerase